VIYLRQSSFKEESISLELQERANRDYAVGQGYEVVAVESDPGISGRTFKRPGVQRVMEMVEAREADIIVLWKWSRFSRSRLDWAVAADKVATFGGRIESATEQIDVSTSTGRLARGMLTEFAAFESERIGDTWKETHARRIRNGLPHHGLPRFGYSYTKQGGYVPDADGAAVLRQLYVRFAAGSTLKELGAYAASEGFEPETGWREGTMRRMLDRGFGAGYIWTKGEHVKGAHKAVVSNREWEEYRARRESRGGRPRAEASDYTFSGLLRCHCGGRMAGAAITRKGVRYPRYVCIVAQQKGTHKAVAVSQPYVEEAVLAWLCQIAAEVDAEASTLEAKPPVSNIERKRQQVKADLAKNASRREALALKDLDGEVSADTYHTLKRKLEEEKAVLEARLRLVAANVTVKPAKIVPKLLQAWPKLTNRQRRELLSRAVDHIQLHERPDGKTTGKREISIHAFWE